MDLELTGKVALVAGASKGIGAATARLLAAEGARLVLAARAGEALSALAQELRDGGAEVEVVEVDFLQSGSGEAAVVAATSRFGALDILVVSIGAAQGGRFDDLDDAIWDTAFALKFMGMVRLLRAATPVMREQGRGSIVAVVGNNGRQPHPRMLPGSAANAACLAVLKGLSEELAPEGVRVNAVNPGPTRTGRWDTLMANLAAGSGRSPADEEADQLVRIPMGRINAPEEIARLVAVLASDVAPSLTGSGLTSDGGATKAF